MKDSITYGQLPADSAFEKTIDGKQTHLYTLKNKNGMEYLAALDLIEKHFEIWEKK